MGELPQRIKTKAKGLPIAADKERGCGGRI
jgi:hypothetical protein